MAEPTVLLGSLAPAFDLPCTRVPGRELDRASLADYRGRWLVLIFYPRDFSLVCPTELTSLDARLEEFRSYGCEVLGISTDPVESHELWVNTPRSQGGIGGLQFPLASDVDGSVSKSFGVYLEWQRVALRGLFIIDPNGVIQYQVVHNLSVGRRSDEVFRVLRALQTGGLCTEGWTPEQQVLDPSEVLGPGRVIGQYRIDRTLGSGSFSTVYRAIDQTLLRPVALKLLKKGSPIKALDEARLAAALSHPNVCTIYAVEASEGAPMIAMELIEGRSLREILASGPLDEATAREIARQVAEGMHAAHTAGVIHGDLKPDNVMVTNAGAVKILDFGLSRRIRAGLDPDETTDLQGHDDSGIFGTPGYMSPEQTEGNVSPAPATDLFSFGVMLYELRSGRKAFVGRNILEVLAKIRLVDPARLASELDEPYRSIVAETLNPDPSNRRITMRDVADRLR